MMRAKSNPARSEKYRRLVASLPCSYCGIEGFSQCAHGPTLGRGIKGDDFMTFPLCCDRPGKLGCHTMFDQYFWSAEARAELAIEWAQETRRALEVAA